MKEIMPFFVVVVVGIRKKKNNYAK